MFLIYPFTGPLLGLLNSLFTAKKKDMQINVYSSYRNNNNDQDLKPPNDITRRSDLALVKKVRRKEVGAHGTSARGNRTFVAR